MWDVILSDQIIYNMYLKVKRWYGDAKKKHFRKVLKSRDFCLALYVSVKFLAAYMRLQTAD